jgi:hypothetical protein
LAGAGQFREEEEALMPPIFKDIDILLFDFHLDFRPLFFPDRLKPDFAFLSDPDLYHQKQSRGLVFAAGGLEVHPVSLRARKRNRFWSRYTASVAPPAITDWHFQTPFGIRPPTNVDCKVPQGSGKLRSMIHVNSLGWSTRLELALSGNLDLDFLQGLTTSILNKEKIFAIQGQPQHLNNLLNHFGKLWQASAYKNPGEPPVDTLPVQRHMIVSVGRFEGAAKSYIQKAGAEEWMTAADRAKLHGVLLGRPFAIQELREGPEQKYLYTQFGDSTNFALSYFDQGSLIFMQDEAAEKTGTKARRKSLGCLARNLSDFSCLALSLDSVLNHPREDTPLKELKVALRHCLKLVGSSYTNEFCKTWFLKHELLRHL